MYTVEDVDEILLVQPQPLLKPNILSTSLSEVHPLQLQPLLEPDRLSIFSRET